MSQGAGARLTACAGSDGAENSEQLNIKMGPLFGPIFIEQ